jgi:pyruvate/2-oxoglutarate dehydrogenase complex dihydrolipoamide acyltransferase (E2) component
VAPFEFRLPDVGEGIATADIGDWLVAEGDRVVEHQDLVEIQTDKAMVVIPCPVTGVVTRLCAREGDTLDVGAVLAVFMADAGADGAAAAAAAPAGPRRPLAAPATRRRARELGVDLAGVTGSGPQGRILREDVEAATSAPAPPAPAPAAARPGEVVPLRGVRRAIAENLTRAWQEVPRVIDYREVDATGLLAARRALKARIAARGDDELARALTPTPLIVLAAVRALRDHPYVNASIDMEAGEITLHGHVHVGIATAAPDGLTVPVVHDADGKGLAQIAREVAALASAAREHRLAPEQLAGATFTVNNYGGLGIWLGTPIVRPPEVANLGVGAIRDQVVAVGGRAVVRPTLALAVAGDHRVLDADTLAAFVTDVVGLLEEPLLLFEDGR